jgi:hypothetical protein
LGGYVNQHPESGWWWLVFLALKRGGAFGSAEVDVEEGYVIVFLNVSEYFALSIIKYFKTTSENHDFGEKKC